MTTLLYYEPENEDEGGWLMRSQNFYDHSRDIVQVIVTAEDQTIEMREVAGERYVQLEQGGCWIRGVVGSDVPSNTATLLRPRETLIEALSAATATAWGRSKDYEGLHEIVVDLPVSQKVVLLSWLLPSIDADDVETGGTRATLDVEANDLWEFPSRSTVSG